MCCSTQAEVGAGVCGKCLCLLTSRGVRVRQLQLWWLCQLLGLSLVSVSVSVRSVCSVCFWMFLSVLILRPMLAARPVLFYPGTRKPSLEAGQAHSCYCRSTQAIAP